MNMILALSYQCKLPWVCQVNGSEEIMFLPSPSFQVSTLPPCYAYTPRAPHLFEPLIPSYFDGCSE